MSAALFSPFTLRGMTLKNRVAVSPMCMYLAQEGLPNAFHFTHYGAFALGGAGLIWLEATAVQANGRISNGDLGLWNDAQAAELGKLAAHIRTLGAVPGVQIGHAGRKACTKPAWAGGAPVTQENLAEGEVLWPVVGCSPIAFAEGWQIPQALSDAEIQTLKADFVSAAQRAAAAGFAAIELHFAHGYLIQSFLSPLTNTRTDAYGGSLENRMRLALEIAREVRAALPSEVVLAARLSATDWIEGGWEMPDTLLLSQALKEAGVDLIDLSSGGNMVGGVANNALLAQSGYQTGFAQAVRDTVKIPVQCVGLIRSAQFANSLVESGATDLVAIGRQMLFNPRWALHAQIELTAEQSGEIWHEAYGFWLEKWQRALARKGETAFSPEQDLS